MRGDKLNKAAAIDSAASIDSAFHIDTTNPFDNFTITTKLTATTTRSLELIKAEIIEGFIHLSYKSCFTKTQLTIGYSYLCKLDFNIEAQKENQKSKAQDTGKLG